MRPRPHLPGAAVAMVMGILLAVDDLAYRRGPLLANVEPAHTGSAAIALVMQPQGRVLRVLSWVSVGLVAAYVGQRRTVASTQARYRIS